MIVRYLSSFDRSFAGLEPSLKERVTQAIDALFRYLETSEKTAGLGLKKLRHPYWEIRAGLKIRIIFSLDKNLLTFILVGDHSAIKRYLRQD
jgi:mRNA-degrading endonuclease YafQ of YafQ-DinJ toxin-antitoxin module